MHISWDLGYLWLSLNSIDVKLNWSMWMCLSFVICAVISLKLWYCETTDAGFSYKDISLVREHDLVVFCWYQRAYCTKHSLLMLGEFMKINKIENCVVCFKFIPLCLPKKWLSIFLKFITAICILNEITSRYIEIILLSKDVDWFLYIT